MSQISFKLLCSGDKRLLSEVFGKWGWFQGQNEDERAMIKTTLMSSCHWKALEPFFLGNKKQENALLTLTVNYLKIVQKKKHCHSKQQ